MKLYILGPAFFALLLLIIFTISVVSYRKYLKHKNLGSFGLPMLRSISFIILLVLLVEPFLTFFNNQKINKEIDIYVDNSKSIAQGISIESLESYVDSIRSWGDSRDYSTNLYLFGEGLRKDGSIDLSESSTRYDHVVKRINSTSNHLNIILTDGQQTHGFRLSDLDINSPVNIVGLGESSVEDISIENVTVPVLANSGDSVSVTIYISSNLSSKASPLLQLKNQETILYSKNIDLSSGDNSYQYDLMIQAPDSYSGEFYLDASISEVSFPENRLNNEFKTQIIIKDESKSTLIVTGSLSPNTQAINTVINDIPDLETSKLYKVSNKWSQPIESFDFSSISVFIYDNFPLSRSDLEIYKKIEKERGEDSKVIFIEGPSYDFNTLNKILSENKKFSKDSGERKELTGRLGFINNLIPVKKNLFISNANFNRMHLMYSDESIAIGQDKDKMYIFIPELSKILINDPSHAFREYLSKTLFMFIDIGGQIVLSSSHRELLEGENLYLDLNYPDIYDDMSYSLYIEAVDSTENASIPFNKIKKDPSGRRYLDNLEEGSYKIYAQIESDSNIYTTNQIDINVAENSIETINVYRDEPELRVAGLKSNGSYFNIENYKGVSSLMKSGISMKRSTLELNVHSFHKFWFILLITLIIEWFLRKRKGLL